MEIFAHLWVEYSHTLLTCVLWAMIGYSLLLPVLLLRAVYATVKVGGLYDIQGAYHSYRRRRIREAKAYCLVIFGGLSMLALFIAG